MSYPHRTCRARDLRGSRVGGALLLAGSVLTAPAASAAETGVVIEKVSVNGGKSIVFGTSRTESFTISVTVSDDSGISKDLAFLAIEREKGATTSNCKLGVKLEKDIDLPRNTLAGPWDVYVQFQAKDGDYYGGVYQTHPVKRRSTLGVDASPEPVTKGKTITVTGKLARANWDKYVYAGYTSQPVKLQFRPKNSATYSTVRTVTSDSTGKLRTTVKAAQDGYWRWSFGGTATTAAVKATGDFVDVR
ncbi:MULTISPECIES: hypothetical protein [unclassified Streptomyces]|uniref:hypothetical protein n=1 Tax=unclassified Streptomyces TaxID=2593676 RepID=UPI0036E6D483